MAEQNIKASIDRDFSVRERVESYGDFDALVNVLLDVELSVDDIEEFLGSSQGKIVYLNGKNEEAINYKLYVGGIICLVAFEIVWVTFSFLNGF